MGGKAFIQKNPVVSYFVMTFLISWIGAFSLIANKLLHGEIIPTLDGLLMFPVMILGPFISGIVLTRVTKGKKGSRDLRSRFNPSRVPKRWYLALLIPPSALLFVLVIFSSAVSKEYSPNLFLIGFCFGIPAGIMEEVGWMGFAFPNMSKNRSALSNSILLGSLWGIWHLPVSNFLGTATPHGAYWLSYFLAFIAVMTAMRVIIAWVYCNTNSVLLSQILHVSSTGFLVMLSPSPMSITHEPIWYFAYSIVLWGIVILLVSRFGKNLVA